MRYLKEHFKHWSMDMTLLYAMNERQEVDLFNEIGEALSDIQLGVVRDWLDPDQPLSGGAAEHIRRFRSENPVHLYRDRSAMLAGISDRVTIRATGHGWCTAEGSDCAGRGAIERTRCVGCDNGVIGSRHVHVWKGMYAHLRELLSVKDIGAAGLLRVERDMERCASVLKDLGIQIEEEASA